MLLSVLLLMISEIDQLNVKCYDARANYWDRFPFPDQLPTLFWKYYTPELGTKVLDIGAGTGRVASYFKESGFAVTCLDPSSEMIRRCHKLDLKTIQTTIQDFDTEEKFGIVVAILSLIHVPKVEWKAQVEKIYHSLEINGLFILSLLKGTTEEIEEYGSGYPRFFARFTPDEVREKLKDNFTELSYYEKNQYMLFFFRKKNEDNASKAK